MWYLITQISYLEILCPISLPSDFYMYSLPFSAHVFFCQEIHLQISLSDPIPFDPPHCLSPSPSPLFSLSPSLESHMVSLKWSTIKRGAQGSHCPHLFSCSAWAVPSLVETVSCDILCLPEGKVARCIYAARTKTFRVRSVSHCR